MYDLNSSLVQIGAQTKSWVEIHGVSCSETKLSVFKVTSPALEALMEGMKNKRKLHALENPTVYSEDGPSGGGGGSYGGGHGGSGGGYSHGSFGHNGSYASNYGQGGSGHAGGHYSHGFGGEGYSGSSGSRAGDGSWGYGAGSYGHTGGEGTFGRSIGYRGADGSWGSGLGRERSANPNREFLGTNLPGSDIHVVAGIITWGPHSYLEEPLLAEFRRMHPETRPVPAALICRANSEKEFLSRLPKDLGTADLNAFLNWWSGKYGDQFETRSFRQRSGN